MAKKQQEKDRVDLRKDFSFNEKKPVQYSLVISVIWFIISFVITLIGFFANIRGFLWNLNAGMVIAIIIAGIWSFVKIGVFESVLFKLQNFRDKSFSLKHDIKVKKETREEYAKRRRKKPWWGVIALASVSITIFVITTIIQYV